MELNYTPESLEKALVRNEDAAKGVPFEGMHKRIFSMLGGLLWFLMIVTAEAFHNIHRTILTPLANEQGWLSVVVVACLLIPLSLFPVLLFHELGHLTAGLLAKLTVLEIGIANIKLKRTPDGFRIQFNKPAPFNGGWVEAIPSTTENLRQRILIFIAGGPLFSCIFLVFLTWLGMQLDRYSANPWFALYLHVTIILQCVILIGSVIPVRLSLFDNDALAISRLFRQPAEVKRHLDLHVYLSKKRCSLYTPDLPEIDADSLLLPADATNDELTALMISYYEAINNSDHEKALYAVNRALDILVANPATRNRLQPLFACNDFTFRHLNELASPKLYVDWFVFCLQQASKGWLPENTCSAVHSAAVAAVVSKELVQAKELAQMGLDSIKSSGTQYNMGYVCAELQSILEMGIEDFEASMATESMATEEKKTAEEKIEENSRETPKFKLPNNRFQAAHPLLAYLASCVGYALFYLVVLICMPVDPYTMYQHVHYRNIGQDCMAKGAEDCAFAAFQTHLDYFPTYDTYQNLGTILRHRGQNEEALQMLNKSIEMGTDDGLTANLERGLLYVNERDFVRATEDFNKVIEESKEESTRDRAISGKAEVYFKLGKRVLDGNLSLSATESQIDESTIDLPKWSSPYYFQGQLHYQAGETDKAIQDYSQAIALSQDKNELFVLHTLRSLLFLQNEELDAAIADASIMIALQPQMTSGYFSRSTLYEQQEELDKARADLDSIIALDPKEADNYTFRGDFFQRHQQFEKALADYTQAIALQPSWGGTYFSRALVFRDAGKLDSALADLNKAIELEPDIFYYASRADIYQSMKQYDLALADYNKAITAYPEWIEFYLKRANVYLEQQRIDLARADFEYILQKTEDNDLKRLAQEKLDTLPKLNG